MIKLIFAIVPVVITILVSLQANKKYCSLVNEIDNLQNADERSRIKTNLTIVSKEVVMAIIASMLSSFVIGSM